MLLPRSQLTKGNFEKLKRLSDSKSKEQIKIEIMGISLENSTLSGKYISGNYKTKPSDLSVLHGTDISNKFFNATVVGCHDFGLFAELDEYGVEVGKTVFFLLVFCGIFVVLLLFVYSYFCVKIFLLLFLCFLLFVVFL